MYTHNIPVLRHKTVQCRCNISITYSKPQYKYHYYCKDAYNVQKIILYL